MNDSAALLVPRTADAAAGDELPMPASAIRSGFAVLLPKLGALRGKSVQRSRFEARQTLGRLGSLEICLVTSAADIRRAQRLRYQVFYREMSAAAAPVHCVTRRDLDAFDSICDHLLIFDRDPVSKHLANLPVATCRLLRQDIAERHGGFYSAGEYRVAELIDRQRGLRFLELGRSCVLRPYRNKRTVELLWHGIWTCVLRHRIDVLIGCASFHETDPRKLAVPLSYLHHYACAPKSWRLCAELTRYVEMNRLPRAAVDVKAAWADLPPLIRGYLRLGAYVGDGAVIDRKFGTTDVAIVLPVSAIEARYIRHFGPTAGRHAL